MTQFIFFEDANSLIDYLISINNCFDNAFFFNGLFNSAIANPLMISWFLIEKSPDENL